MKGDIVTLSLAYLSLQSPVMNLTIGYFMLWDILKEQVFCYLPATDVKDVGGLGFLWFSFFLLTCASPR